MKNATTREVFVMRAMAIGLLFCALALTVADLIWPEPTR